MRGTIFTLIAVLSTTVTGGAAAEAHDRAALPSPAGTLSQFVEAAGAGNAAGMWRLLSKPTQRRMGPTYDRFRSKAATELARRVGPYARLGFRVVLAQRITAAFAVAAVAARRTAERRGEYAAFAAALRRAGTRWRLELGGPIRIEAVRPLPGERVQERTQLAAEVVAQKSIDQAGLWFDGIAFDARGAASTDGRSMTMWGEAPQPLRRGGHSVVAFAAAGSSASAIAWAFSVR